MGIFPLSDSCDPEKMLKFVYYNKTELFWRNVRQSFVLEHFDQFTLQVKTPFLKS